MADTGFFQINDIVLNIAPEQIAVHRQSFNHQWQTLRTRSSIKAKSGFSQLSITFTVPFTTTVSSNGENGFSQLRDLVAQFRVTPFCYVENQYLRNTILSGDRSKSMALALRQLELRTTPNNPNLIEASFSFVWFNYLPFLPEFSFKEDIFGNSIEVRDPRQSKAWKLMYRAEQHRWTKKSKRQAGSGQAIQKFIDSKIEFEVPQYATISVEKYNKLELEYIAVQELRYKLLAQQGGGHEGQMNQFVFRSLKDSLRNYNKIEVQSLVEELFGSTTSMGSPDNDKKVLSKLLQSLDKTLGPDTHSKYQLVIDQDKWKPVFNKKGEAIKLGQSPTSLADHIGNMDAKNEIIVSRTRSYDTDKNGIVVTGMSLSFENILATLPLNGHKFPTYQHIGSTDAVVTISMETTSEEGLRSMTEMYDLVEEQSYNYRNIPQGHRNLTVRYNSLLGMFGLSDFVPENLVSNTTPNNPGTYSMILTMVDNPLDVETVEKFSSAQGFTTTQSLRSEISKIILGYLTTDFNKVKSKAPRAKDTFSINPQSPLTGVDTGSFSLDTNSAGIYRYSSGKTGGRDEIFKDLCLRYGRELSQTVLSIRDAIAIRPGVLSNDAGVANFYAFFGLEEDTILAVERMQEDILPAAQKLGYYDKTIGLDTGLEVLKNNISSELERKLEDQKNRKALIASTKGTGAAARAAKALYREDSNWINALQSGEAFRREYTSTWEVFSQRFIDLEILANGLIYVLPQFAKIRELLSDISSGSTGNNYPDFPLTEVIDLLKAEGGKRWETAKTHLTSQLEKQNAKFKGLDVTSFVQPDFYFFNRLDAQASRLISSDIIKKASDNIISSHSERKEAEDTWFEGVYNQRLGQDKLQKMESEVHAFTKERDELWAAKSGPKKESSDKIRSLLERELVWESDYMTPDEKSIACSSAEEKKNFGAINLSEIKGTEGHNTIVSKRPQASISPPTYAWDCQHRFGLDAIKYLGKVAYSPFSSEFGEDGPNFIWPCDTGIEGCSSGFGPRIRSAGLERAGEAQFHNGIDIVSGTGGLVDRKYKAKGTAVYAAAKGTLKFVANPEDRASSTSGAGNSIVIEHSNGWSTHYMHMLNDDWIRATWRKKQLGQININAGDRIGSIGSTGGSTGPHLHFEIRQNGVAKPPRRGDRWHSSVGGTNSEEGVMDGDFYAYTKPSIPEGLDPENESMLTRSVEQFEKGIKRGQGPSMMRAYPTFRLYFIESDMGERKRFGFDDFFSYSSVKEIQVIRNRKIPTDLCIIQLTNISGVLSNRKFGGDDPQDQKGEKLEENPFDSYKTNTSKENPLASTMLQPGIQIQLRLGYHSNPEELEKVFNGVITDVQFTENDDMVTIICQSFAIEMVQDLHGQAVSYGGWFSGTGRTSKLLEEMMASPEMVHFGRWEGGKAKNSARGLLTDRWTLVPQPQDDNIFAPTGPGEIFGLFDFTAKYVLYQTTIWDVFQEMTLRHPGYIAYPVPYEGKYGPRMTMFFGLPNQLYFSRDPSFREEGNLGTIRRALEDTIDISEEEEDLINRWISDPSFDPSSVEKEKIEAARATQNDDQTKEAVTQYMEGILRDFSLDKGIIKPFRNYHLLTGSQHIMHNNISSSNHNTFNVATIQYSDDEPEADEDNAKVNFDDPETFTLACDAGIPDEDKRELFGQYPNCVGYEMAKRYSLSVLSNSLKEGYRGSLIIVGNEKIKPHDVCYIFDEYTDMMGPIEVEQVVHKFSQRNGFITEITPDMCIQVNQHATMASQDAMGLIAENYLGRTAVKEIAAMDAFGSNIGTLGGASILKNVFNKGEHSLDVGTSSGLGTMAGAFVFRKFIARSQLAHPFRYSPLVKNGKALIGGFPTKIVDGGFLQGIKTWVKDWDQNIGLAWDDFYDKIHPNNWANKTQGSFNKYLFGDD